MGVFHKKLNVLGKRFGKLVVLAETPMTNKAGSPLYECICDCGGTAYRAAPKLLASNCPSCAACKEAHNKGKPRKEAGESGLNTLYCSYRKGAQARNYVFELTKEDVRSITTQPCFYCGAAPSRVTYGSTGFTKDHGGFLSNGIDRVDNNIGYTKDNSVPCCHVCNYMKGVQSLPDFVAHCRKIIENFSIS